MVYLTTLSTHFIYGYMALDIIMVNNQLDCEMGNPLPPRGLLLPISSKGSFICTIPHTAEHIPRPLLNQSWSTGWNEQKLHMQNVYNLHKIGNTCGETSLLRGRKERNVYLTTHSTHFAYGYMASDIW